MAGVAITLLVIAGGVIFSRLSQKEIPAWMHKDARLKRLTNEAGAERGKISPDGRYIVYQDEDDQLQLKMIKISLQGL